MLFGSIEITHKLALAWCRLFSLLLFFVFMSSFSFVSSFSYACTLRAAFKPESNPLYVHTYLASKADSEPDSEMHGPLLETDLK